MGAIEDVWEHAQHVRMWLQTAHDALGRATTKSAGGFLVSWFTRGRSRSSDLNEAVDAIGKLKLAYLDLEHAQTRAGRTPLPLQTVWLDVVRAPSFVVGGVALNRTVVDRLTSSVTADLGAIDSLIEEVEHQQKQQRSLR